MDFNNVTALFMYYGQLKMGTGKERWATFEIGIAMSENKVRKYIAYVDDFTGIEVVKKYFNSDNIGKKMLLSGSFNDQDGCLIFEIRDIKLWDKFVVENEVKNLQKRFVLQQFPMEKR